MRSIALLLPGSPLAAQPVWPRSARLAVVAALLLPLAGCLDLLDSGDDGPNQPPTAYITMPQQGAVVEVDQPFQLVGYGEDPDDEDSQLGYVWTLAGLGEVIELSRLASDMVTVSQTGPDLVLTLTVTDPHGASASDVKLITVEPGNRPPTAVILGLLVEYNSYNIM